MKLLPVIIVVALTFGVCFLLDFVFRKIFRNKTQHKSGLAVKASKKYAAFGLIAVSLGVAALFSAKTGLWVVIAGSAMILLGVCLIVYFLTFGIYYDEDSFIYSTFGRKNRVYKYDCIKAQQLYASGANMVIELHLSDGSTLQLQSTMDGVHPFLNKAFHGWVRQNNKLIEDCEFYDPHRFSWFPDAQED